jgi:hypothetical protein
MKFDYPQLLKKPSKIACLEVQSFEMNVYLVKLTIDGREGMLFDREQLKRFHSSQEIRDAFESFTVERAIMVHDSPYDEMIGNPEKTTLSVALPFSMLQPY